MTFAGVETSQEAGRPVELYTFQLSLVTYRYTSAEDDQVVGGETFIAIPISRGKINFGQESKSAVLSIEMPSDEALPSRYVTTAPSERANVTLQRFHRGDGQLATFFVGLLKSVAFSDDGRKATVAVEPAITAASKQIPLFTFRGQCNNVLGDGFGGGSGLCDANLSDPAYKLTATVTAQSGLTITVPGAAAFGTGWFDAGTIETSSALDARLIIRQVGDLITLHINFPFPLVGEMVTLRAGCAHDIMTCSTKFNNVDVFQGFFFLPTINIFEAGLDPAICN